MSRSTTKRDRHRRTISRGHPPCHWCNHDIDYQAHWLSPLAFQIDHVIPLNKGGIDELHNPDGSIQIVASHRRCNRAKSDRIMLPAGTTFVTERAW